MADDNRICAITGCSGGIGKAAAIDLAAKGFDILMLVRDSPKSRSAHQEIMARAPGGKVSLHFVDLASQKSILSLARELRSASPRIDVLLNNAGVFRRRRETSPDGLELTFAVNSMAPFLLTQLLLPLLRAGTRARIVHVSSELYKNGDLETLDPGAHRKYKGVKVYAATKLALNLVSKAMAQRYEEYGIASNAVHPGVAGTDVLRDYPRWIVFFLKLLVSSPEAGAVPLVHAASSDEAEGVSGEYFYKTRVRQMEVKGKFDDLVRRSWDICMAGVTDELRDALQKDLQGDTRNGAETCSTT
jgi:NAD(P)-dependent dehydrogenase (short-subunit alcohol dehydrogenase family)